jgi:hypothetical protein
MTEVFLGNQASEFGLKVHVREDCPAVCQHGRTSTQGLKMLILLKILYQLKIMLQNFGIPPPPKKNK